MINNIMLVFLFVVLISLFIYKWYSDKQWQKKPLRNFPFFHKGKLFWYSRSVATTIGVFCKNKNNEWCVLANQRGQGAPDFKGYWNIVCGYLEHDVTGEENCQKEVFEETGVFVPASSITFNSINTSPSENRQNVGLRYCAVLNGVCDDYKVTDENSEKDEVADVKWIPIDEIDEYTWAFDHKNLIQSLFNDCVLKDKVA
jgi:ADP-ribose pyrophosphatase YjhB (NUDIX family)